MDIYKSFHVMVFIIISAKTSQIKGTTASFESSSTSPTVTGAANGSTSSLLSMLSSNSQHTTTDVKSSSTKGLDVITSTSYNESISSSLIALGRNGSTTMLNPSSLSTDTIRTSKTSSIKPQTNGNLTLVSINVPSFVTLNENSSLAHTKKKPTTNQRTTLPNSKNSSSNKHVTGPVTRLLTLSTMAKGSSTLPTGSSRLTTERSIGSSTVAGSSTWGTISTLSSKTSSFTLESSPPTSQLSTLALGTAISASKSSWLTSKTSTLTSGVSKSTSNSSKLAPGTSTSASGPSTFASGTSSLASGLSRPVAGRSTMASGASVAASKLTSANNPSTLVAVPSTFAKGSTTLTTVKGSTTLTTATPLSTSQTGETVTLSIQNTVPTEKQNKKKKSASYDKELVITFGAAVALGLVVTVIFCILKCRKDTKQERFITGGGDIEINTSKF